MGLVVPDEGEVHLLDMLVGGTDMTGLHLRLYKNNLTPDQDTVLSDFTEADFSGYAQVSPSFGSASTVSHKGKIVDTSARNFTHNGGGTSNTVYGYYLVNSFDNVCLWAERFSSSQVVAVSGDTITITLALTAQSEN